MLLGAHMSISGGLDKAIDRARSIGCTALQLFTANARGWKSRVIPDEEVAAFREKAEAFGRQTILAHDGYLINLAAEKPDLLKKSVDAFAEEVDRCDALGIERLVMHPGAAGGQKVDEALAKVADSFNRIFDKRPDSKVNVLIEITAGQGTTLGGTFEQIAAIINQMEQPDRFGVCFDTCHAYAAGYDIANKTGFLKTFRDFNNTLGISRLMAFHLNDAKKGLGSHLDRHEHIGKGELGLEAFRLIMNDRRFKKLPMTLETPKGEDLAEDVENLGILKSLVGKKLS